MIKILIVDDEETTCGYIADFFKERGHISIIETDPRKALEVISKEQPHIVLLDVLMPRMNGLDVLGAIKKQYKDKMKVIMVTVADDDKTVKEAERLGADDFIRKPFDTTYLEDVVMTKIQELLDNSPYIRKADSLAESLHFCTLQTRTE